MRRESTVRLAALTAGAQFGHRGSRKRVSEHKSPVTIDPNQLCTLGGRQPLEVWLAGRDLQDAEITCRVERGQQQQVP